jgi:hypothetical protein
MHRSHCRAPTHRRLNRFIEPYQQCYLLMVRHRIPRTDGVLAPDYGAPGPRVRFEGLRQSKILDRTAVVVAHAGT